MTEECWCEKSWSSKNNISMLLPDADRRSRKHAGIEPLPLITRPRPEGWIASDTKAKKSVPIGKLTVAEELKEEATVKMVVKQASLQFARGLIGQGTVSLIEEYPLRLAGKEATGRHFEKKYFLRIEGFRVTPGTLSNGDVPLYLYTFREPLTQAQARNPWNLTLGLGGEPRALVSTNPVVRAGHDTSDAELLLFDDGIAGSLRGGRAETETFVGAARSLPIGEFLRGADAISAAADATLGGLALGALGGWGKPRKLATFERAFLERGWASAGDLLGGRENPWPEDDADLDGKGLTIEVRATKSANAFLNSHTRVPEETHMMLTFFVRVFKN